MTVYEIITAIIAIGTTIAALLSIFLRLLLRAALAEFRLQLLADLDRRYVLRAEHEMLRARSEGGASCDP